MDLQIRPFHKNIYPIQGILVRSSSVVSWIKEIQCLQLDLRDIQIYPIPSTIANSIWGCLIVTQQKIDIHSIRNNELCQIAAPNLFIPEKTILFPSISTTELEKLFPSVLHIFHPEFGLVELTDEVDFEKLIQLPVEKSLELTKPHDSVFIPKQIKSYQVIALPPDQILRNLEEKISSQPEEEIDKPLTILEKAKLGLYSLLFTKTRTDANDKENSTLIEKTGFWTSVEPIVQVMSRQEHSLSDTLQQDFEALENRNRPQIDKLLDMLKNNPGEALKYAIPLDIGGTVRGRNIIKLKLSKWWLDFSVTGNTSKTGSGMVDIGDYYQELQKQYNDTALKMIQQKDYQKAAFIYMKLLKNKLLAAQTLESGNHYQEAATIYLHHTGNKTKAAECYEKGNMINEAIEIFKELQNYEKVGDLYLAINKRKEANIYFEKVIADYKAKSQYIKASLIYKYKMNDTTGGQSLLLEGWQSFKDPFNCLNNYFSNIKEKKMLQQEIERIYSNELTERNSTIFLQVIRHEYNKNNELAELIREMAYQIIAEQLPANPSIISELREFNPKDNQLRKDTIRFRINMKQ